MLMGTYQNSIDAKNRVIIPSRFRDELGYRAVLSRGLDHCLVIYPLETWEEQQKLLSTLPKSDPQARAFIRYIYANAVECEIDKQGRTVIPQNLKSLAGIQKDLVTIGFGDRVEIWGREVYESDEQGGMLSSEEFKDFSAKYQV
ncbi:MAG: division/cell wall cluster transcriptional repressor MraZ [Firmicutes bacterium]|nr:division/cell wall cluster transcriptional repressor MraZ [Bacillota bacterium]MBQ4180818.1 division/cell wall cluster transcriptional repressor MraZ [Bacillota bacterium]